MSGLRSYPDAAARRAAGLLLAVGFLCLIALQSPGASSSVPSPGRQDLSKPLQHEVTVALKLIHVYVTDKKGKPIQDLTLEDFTVTDNGRPVVLTDFEKHSPPASPEEAPKADQVGEKAAAAALPPASLKTTRKFFLFFDFAFNNSRGIVKAKAAALHFLDKELEPDDEVGILTYSMFKGVRVHEYLTPDQAKIREVVDSIGSKDIAGRASEIEQQYWLQAQEPLAGSGSSTSSAQAALPQKIAEANRQESKRVAQTFILKLTALAKSLRYIPGQKHFIFFSTGVPSSIIYGGQSGNPSGLPGGRAMFDPGDRILRTQSEEMYQEFGAANCTFYAFDTRESAKEADLFAYDKLTFETGSRGFTSTQGVFQDSTDIFRDEKTTGLNSLKRLSDITGGKFYSNINMYEKNLDQVQALTGTYYVLGYSVGEQEDGRFHKIKASVRRPNCEVRAQAGYFNPQPYREFTPLEKQLHLYDLALNERSLSRLPVSFPLTALAFGTGGSVGLEILAAVPGEVTAKFSGEKVEYIALIFDAKSDICDVRRVEADPRPRRGQAVVFTSGVSLEPGDYTCRLVIRDMDTGVSAVSSVQATVRAAPGQGLRLGTPLLLKDETGCAYLDAGAAKGRATVTWGDAYDFDKTALSPAVGPVSKLTLRLVAVIPFAVPGTGEPDVVFSARLIDAATGAVLPVAFALVERNWHPAAQAVGLEFPVVGLAPGRYFLYLTAEDRVSKTLANVQTALIISDD
ncbi:MAG: VWA domain-containing protein [Candidatus Aminicenantes bacterium]|nr:VWA domain-containing protein [Candidatus Aminicenantes bacterium]